LAIVAWFCRILSGILILTNRAGGFTKLVACLLAVLTIPRAGLIDVAFPVGDLIRKRLFPVADLLLLLFACASRLSVARSSSTLREISS